MILAYHEIVAGRSSYLYSVSGEELERHLIVLKDLSEATRPDSGPVEVTFDDGHISQYRYALPLLEKLGIRARFFVTAGWTGIYPQYMDAQQLRELVSLGHEVRAHGWSHKMLTQCSPAELRQELLHAKYVLEDMLGSPVASVSVPHGRWNDSVIEFCASSGYEQVYISDPHVDALGSSGVRVIGRLMMTRKISSRSLERLLTAGRRHISLSRLEAGFKRALRSAIGETRYHRAWLLLSKKEDRLPARDSIEQTMRVLHQCESNS